MGYDHGSHPQWLCDERLMEGEYPISPNIERLEISKNEGFMRCYLFIDGALKTSRSWGVVSTLIPRIDAYMQI